MPVSEIRQRYKAPSEQKLVQAAAKLVDGGMAGILSRLEEIAEFSLSMGYKKIGIAYCYGMESEALQVRDYLKEHGVPLTSVCCTAGAMPQSEINEESDLPGVSCNPIMQAEQLNASDVQLVVTMGLCLGHDILFNRYLKVDSTNLVVKDRTTGHNPLQAVRKLSIGESGNDALN